VSEAVKKPIQKPESYKPGEKPEIVNLSEQKSSKVVTNGKLTYIDNVPTLGWNIPWRNCTFSGSASLLLNAMGTKTTYEQVMGLSGSCYRASMAYGWDFGSNIVDITYYWLKLNCDNVNRFYGMKFAGIDTDNTTEEEREKLARESIDAGVPVLVMGGRGAPEWGVMLGYEQTDNRYKYFGRSYFDGNLPKNESFTENRYALMGNFPKVDHFMLFNNPSEPISALDALKRSLEICQIMFQPHDKFGYGAYEKIISSLEKNEYTTKWNSEGDIDTIFINFADARKAANIYLLESADLLKGQNKNNLLKVASLYKDMFDILHAIINEKGITTSEQTRNKIIEGFRRTVELERQAQEIIKSILCNWQEF